VVCEALSRKTLHKNRAGTHTLKRTEREEGVTGQSMLEGMPGKGLSLILASRKGPLVRIPSQDISGVWGEYRSPGVVPAGTSPLTGSTFSTFSVLKGGTSEPASQEFREGQVSLVCQC
jgi:hypothetical protein